MTSTATSLGEIKGHLREVFTEQGDLFYWNLREAFRQRYPKEILDPLLLNIFTHKDLIGKFPATGGHLYVIDYFILMKLEQEGIDQDLSGAKEIAYERFIIEYMTRFAKDHPPDDDTRIEMSQHRLEEILRSHLSALEGQPMSSAELEAEYENYVAHHPFTKPDNEAA